MSYSTAAIATFNNVLGTLDHLAAKAEAAGLPDNLLADAKLADDMFPLETQFRIAINQAYMGLGRVWGMDIPLDEAAYATFAEVRERLAAARDRITEAEEREAAPSDAEIDMTLPNGMRFVMQAHEYLRDWTMPNVYFHASTAYGLLRREGLALGKVDFMGFLLRYAKPPAA
ncbi:hypothetical protein A6F68_00449 [Tsuneonella dongtanensis]|uniref:DUF1993 domain-containing protein n=1 Tax=Tsuneonella dongtanensis TaxID=692370 RepID=A0A1B2AA66_9SPHN|nr:DUF1993 domain-containing protein [Tsuneonella dongtanensis]ANY18984.1 hypothetical protein A6F68_00449 [Tsuneonella dongtanensis]